MFNTASRRLTIWYVACIMALSLAFSVWVYQEAVKELRMAFNDNRVMVYLRGQSGQNLVDRQIELSRKRIILNLVYLNVFVFIASSVGSYFLARRTLQPIEDAVEAQKRFTADASHELRTPLASMKTELEVALRDPQLTKQEMRELLESNVEEINRMSGLTEGLLALARPDSMLPLELIRLDTVIKDALAPLQPLVKNKHIQLISDTPKVHGRANKVALQHMVSILVDNAIKYSPDEARVYITLSGNGGGQISVRDTGPGISEDDIPYIFDRFYRADTSRTAAQSQGYGLGLSIAQKLACATRADIRVRNISGSGAEFIINLPR